MGITLCLSAEGLPADKHVGERNASLETAVFGMDVTCCSKQGEVNTNVSRESKEHSQIANYFFYSGTERTPTPLLPQLLSHA